MNNPIVKAIIAAIIAAYTELTTPEAMQWYKDTAIKLYAITAALTTMAWCLVKTWLIEPYQVSVIPQPVAEPAPLAIYDIRSTLAMSGGSVTSVSNKRYML
jgi:hypothetical protein